MVGMKEKLGDNYERWYKRHRLVEQYRVWKKTMEEVSVPFLPDYERELPETYSLIEAFYHPSWCKCGSCVSPLGLLMKKIHVDAHKEEPWTRGPSSLLPTPPDHLLPLLQDAAAIVLSPPDHG